MGEEEEEEEEDYQSGFSFSWKHDSLKPFVHILITFVETFFWSFPSLWLSFKLFGNLCRIVFSFVAPLFMVVAKTTVVCFFFLNCFFIIISLLIAE